MFVHLHNHTVYSLLDGASRIPDLVEAAVRQGSFALAITDHGVLYGAIEFYKACRQSGIKPIIGCEVYTTKSIAAQGSHGQEDLGHLVLLAADNAGYGNLVRLVSRSFVDGFYYKPRVDLELLQKYSDGLIALSGCLAGDIPALLLRGEDTKAEQFAASLKSIFPGRFYLEIQRHDLPEEDSLNRRLVELGKRMGIPLVATNDSHYIRQQDARIHDLLLCIGTQRLVSEPGRSEDPDGGRLKFPNDTFHLRSAQEMERLFSDLPTALENCLEIAEQCNVELDFNQLRLPSFPLPPGESEQSMLRRLCEMGLEKRYQRVTSQVRDRLERELEVISSMGFDSYFLIIWDVVRFARSSGIQVGPGRGSATGSLVSYLLQITDIDPVEHGLYFERFLNPARSSMPDIDVDFDDERRDEVFEYVKRKYGQERVAHIIAFGTLGARAAIRDVGRVLGVNYDEVDEIARLVPSGPNVSLQEVLKTDSTLRQMCSQSEVTNRLIRHALAVEGIPRHSSVHACGIVIGDRPLEDDIPLALCKGKVVTQFDKDTLESDLGMLKMDFLSLRNLTVIKHTLRSLESSGQSVKLEELPKDDPQVMRFLAKGETMGIFQFESEGMRRLLQEFKPESIADLTLLNAAYRPGPMDSIPDIIARKHGRKSIEYLHPRLEPILAETYGVYIYQEQIMRIAQELAGWSPAEADLFRDAVKKKDPDVLLSYKQRFVQGCKSQGISPETAVAIFEPIVPFAGYAFNKSHAAGYALIAYQTAYLKYYFPAHFMAALLTSVQGNTDRMARYVEECRRQGIPVLGPDVNLSDLCFTVGERKGQTVIRYGLAAVKNVGLGAAEKVLAARQDGAFHSLADFCLRVDIPRPALEALVKSGAMSRFGNRAQLLAALDGMPSSVRSRAKQNPEQATLFELQEGLEEDEVSLEDRLPDIDEFSQERLLAMEREYLGVYITSDLLQEHAALLHLFRVRRTDESPKTSRQASVAGYLVDLQTRQTRNGHVMAVAELDNGRGQIIRLPIWPHLWRRYSHLARPGCLLLAWGSLRRDQLETPPEADETPADSGPAELRPQGLLFFPELDGTPWPVPSLTLYLSPAALPNLPALSHLLRAHPGDVPLLLVMGDAKGLSARSSDSCWVVLADKKRWVSDRPELQQGLKQMSSELGFAYRWERGGNDSDQGLDS